jgi:outer membrane immunogenic protein
MRSVSLAASVVGACLLATAATAADLPRRASPAYAPLPPAFTWTGPYFGVTAGGAFNVAEKTGFVAVPAGTFGPGAPPVSGTISYAKRERNGFTGGGVAGYNLQLGATGFVAGLEADIQYAGLTTERPALATASFVAPAAIALLDPRGSRGVDWFGTVRGRVGYAFDRILAYGTGGLAYGEGGRGACFGAFGCGDGLRFGWAAGAGLEYAMPTDAFLYVFQGGALTLRAEALYVSLDHGRNAGLFAYNTVTNAGYYAPGAGKSGDDFAVIRAGLTYKFGGW